MIRVSIKLLEVVNFEFQYFQHYDDEEDNPLHRFEVKVEKKQSLGTLETISQFKLTCDKSMNLLTYSPLNDETTFTRIPDEYEINLRAIIESYLCGFFRKDGFCWIEEVKNV